jgi:hypothetical protein
MSGIAASRRTVLRTAGLVGIGSVATAATPTAAFAASADHWHPDPDSPRFTLVVMPDTQYLFDADRIHPEPLAASFDYMCTGWSRRRRSTSTPGPSPRATGRGSSTSMGSAFLSRTPPRTSLSMT